MSKRPRRKRVLRAVLIGLVGFELVYVLASNLALSTGIVTHFANLTPEQLTLSYARGWTLIPGRLHVTDLRLRFQDRNVEFEIGHDTATVDVRLIDLLGRKFHVTHVDATGVSWRQVTKIEELAGQEERVAAFPVIPGMATPPLKTPPPPPQPDPNPTGKGVWSVEIDNVEGTVKEVWVMEYRYQGPGRCTGSFEVKPNQFVWVGPAGADLTGGTLSAGAHVISTNFKMQTQMKIEKYDIHTHPGLTVFRPLSASVHLEMPVEDLSAAQLYVPGLELKGNGTLHADLQLVEGKLAPGTMLDLMLPLVALRDDDVAFRGNASAHAWVDPSSEKPMVRLALEGVLSTPLEKKRVAAKLSGVSGVVLLTHNDLASGLALDNLRGQVKEARVEDASAIKSAAASKVPIFLPQLLGDGPLVASGSIYLTPTQTLLRLDNARLGGARTNGAMVLRSHRWNGAFAGRLGELDVGLRIQNDTLGVLPLIASGWLERELVRAGITPSLAVEPVAQATGRALASHVP